MTELANGGVYFQPVVTFTACTDGITPLQFVAGKDENDDPLVYVVPGHQARNWERQKKGQIVDIRRVIKGSPLPPVPPVNEKDIHEVVAAPLMSDPALKTTATPAASPTASPSGQASAETTTTGSDATADATAKPSAAKTPKGAKK